MKPTGLVTDSDNEEISESGAEAGLPILRAEGLSLLPSPSCVPLMIRARNRRLCSTSCKLGKPLLGGSADAPGVHVRKQSKRVLAQVMYGRDARAGTEEKKTRGTSEHREGTPLHQIELSTVHRTGVVGPNTQIAACGGASKTLDAVKKKKKQSGILL